MVDVYVLYLWLVVQISDGYICLGNHWSETWNRDLLLSISLNHACCCCYSCLMFFLDGQWYCQLIRVDASNVNFLNNVSSLAILKKKSMYVSDMNVLHWIVKKWENNSLQELDFFLIINVWEDTAKFLLDLFCCCSGSILSSVKWTVFCEILVKTKGR